MIKNLAFLILIVSTCPLWSQQFVATYGFPELTPTTGTVDPSNTPSVNGLLFGSFKARGVSVQPSASGRFSFTNWPTGAINGEDNYSFFTGVLSPTVYYEVSIAVNPGYTLNLTDINFSMRRSGTGIRHYCVRSNRDNYTHNLAASTGTNTRLSVLPTHVFYWNYDSVNVSSEQWGSSVSTDSSFSAITDSVSFRFYAWNAESPGGSFSIDNVAFRGILTDSAGASNPVGLPSLQDKFFNAHLYPNPSNDGRIFIKYMHPIEHVEVFTCEGLRVFSEKMRSSSPDVGLNLSFLPAGLYLVYIHSKEGSYRHKLVIKGDK